MDASKELLIKKKWEITEYLYAAMIIVGFPVVYTLAYYLLAIMGIRYVSFLAFAGLIYVAYLLFLKLFREFEYTFFNGSLVVDVIYSKKKRKTILECETKNIVFLGKYDVDKYADRNFDKRVFAGEAIKSSNLLCAEIEDDDNVKSLLIFSPTKEFLEKMKPFMKQSVIREALKDM